MARQRSIPLTIEAVPRGRSFAELNDVKHCKGRGGYAGDCEQSSNSAFAIFKVSDASLGSARFAYVMLLDAQACTLCYKWQMRSVRNLIASALSSERQARVIVSGKSQEAGVNRC